ncbi:Tubby protein-like [Hondaea fermentalgiana]|uniref:Tubby protein-like n=1 Tax=Hondaea fermentalgiana TaxID=2315210 RepID=A0A2R5GMR8_9STRA|nr:Tubby protein-like [Hondaea fermentalgiana]|eukprot:GBG32192.1 Tubby protein-like [Hondaea fermentalgiana]
METLARHLSMSEHSAAGSTGTNEDMFTFGSQPGTPLSRRFSDIDMLEFGVSKETIIEEHLTPVGPSVRKLRRCHVIREDKVNFYLYCELTDRFMLSAKMDGDMIYISQYEEFCSSFVSEKDLMERPGKLGSGETFCAALRLNSQTKSFTMYNRVCEGCDDVLGMHTCGAQSRANGDRQVLLEVKHGSRAVQAGPESWIDCNIVHVKLPVVYADLSRDVWCPRFPKGSISQRSVAPANNTYSAYNTTSSVNGAVSDSQSMCRSYSNEECEARPLTPGRSKARRDSAGPTCNTDSRHEEDESKVEGRGKYGYSFSAGKNTRIDRLVRANSVPVTRADLAETAAVDPLAGNDKGECIINTRVPRYDRNTGSLRMKFLNNRVRIASSKNLIFCLDRESDKLSPQPSASSAPEKFATEDRVVLQFGKYNDERFNLDFRFPLAPVQAFGIALSLFNWQAGNDK